MRIKNKPINISFRMSPEEAFRLQEITKVTKLSQSDVFRRLILGASVTPNITAFIKSEETE